VLQLAQASAVVVVVTISLNKKDLESSDLRYPLHKPPITVF